MRDTLIALGLRGRSPAAGGSIPARAAQLLLDLLFDFMTEVDPIETGTLVARLEMCRLLTESQMDAQLLETLTRTCTDARDQVRNRLAKHHDDQRTEMAALVALVRETLDTLSGSEGDFHTKFGDSMTRIDALSQVDDVGQLKAQLAREVAMVRWLALERNQAWQEICRSLTQRVSTLEDRLTETTIAATVDALTGLTTRGAFEKTLAEWLVSPRRQLVLAFIDLDNLKSINDSYGHQIGDRAIVTVATALKRSFRADVDVVARYGGDEFVLLMHDVGIRQAESRLRMLVQSLLESPIEGEGSAAVTITVSCGIAEYSAGDTRDSLFERADAALYDAKRTGRDRIVSKEKPTLRSLMRH